MNRKYIGSSLIGVGIFGSVLGNVAHAVPLSDEEWAKFEEKTNENVNYPEKDFWYVLRMLLSYVNPSDWIHYFKVDRNFKRCTEDNIDTIRRILSTFKDTFKVDLNEYLSKCNLLEDDDCEKVISINNGSDQRFSLQKEAKLLNVLEQLFKNFDFMDEYMRHEKVPLKGQKGGGVFEKFRNLIDFALDAHYERNKFIDSDEAKVVSDAVLTRWRNLEKQNYILELTKQNIEICKKILDILKDYFNLGEGSEAYLREKHFITLESVESSLMQIVNNILFNYGRFYRDCASPQSLDDGLDGVKKKVEKLKELLKLAAYNKKLRDSFLEKGDWFKVGRLARCNNFFDIKIEDNCSLYDVNVKSVEDFTERYKRLFKNPLPRNDVYEESEK